MYKEEIINNLKKLRLEFKEYLSDSYMLNLATDIIDNQIELVEKNNDLQQRIDKAIEYIENTRVDNNYMVQEKYEYLLEILGEKK